MLALSGGVGAKFVMLCPRFTRGRGSAPRKLISLWGGFFCLDKKLASGSPEAIVPEQDSQNKALSFLFNKVCYLFLDDSF